MKYFYSHGTTHNIYNKGLLKLPLLLTDNLVQTLGMAYYNFIHYFLDDQPFFLQAQTEPFYQDYINWYSDFKRELRQAIEQQIEPLKLRQWLLFMHEDKNNIKSAINYSYYLTKLIQQFTDSSKAFYIPILQEVDYRFKFHLKQNRALAKQYFYTDVLIHLIRLSGNQCSADDLFQALNYYQSLTPIYNKVITKLKKFTRQYTSYFANDINEIVSIPNRYYKALLNELSDVFGLTKEKNTNSSMFTLFEKSWNYNLDLFQAAVTYMMEHPIRSTTLILAPTVAMTAYYQNIFPKLSLNNNSLANINLDYLNNAGLAMLTSSILSDASFAQKTTTLGLTTFALGLTQSYAQTYSGIEQLPFNTLSQGTSQFVKVIGLNSDFNDAANTIHAQADGSIVMTGWTGSYRKTGDNDILVSKYTSQGALEWAQVFGGSLTDISYAAWSNAQGDIFLTGTTYNFLPIEDINLIIAKLSTNGTLEWIQVLDDPRTSLGHGNTQGYAIHGNSDSDIVVAGSIADLSGQEDALIVKLDTDGTIKWARALASTEFSGTNWDVARSVYNANDGSLFITGATGQPGANNILVAKISSNGNLLWARAIGGSQADASYAAHINQAGNLVVTGYTHSFGPITAGYDNLFVLKLNPDATLAWAKVFNVLGEGYAIQLDANENVNLIGRRHNVSAGYDDMFIANLNYDGTLKWSKLFGSVKNEYGLALSFTGSRLLFSGWSSSFSASGTDAIIAAINLDESTALNCPSFQPIQPDIFSFTPAITVIEPNLNTISFNQITPNLNTTFIRLEEDFVCNSVPATTGTTNFSTTSTTGFLSSTGTINTATSGITTGQNFSTTTGGNAFDSPQFVKVIGRNSHYNDAANAIHAQADGNIVMTGWTRSYRKTGDDDILVSKYTPQGTFEWSRVFSGSSTDVGRAAWSNAQSDIFITGITLQGSDTQLLVAKLNTNGTLEWIQALDAPGTTEGNAIHGNANGDVVVAGTIIGPSGYADNLIVKLDTYGNIKWARALANTAFSGKSDEVARSVYYADDGNIFITGPTVHSGIEEDILAAKISSDGNLIWARTIGGSQRDTSYAAHVNQAGNFILTGHTNSFGPNVGGYVNVFALNLNPDASLAWARVLDVQGEGYSIQFGVNNNINIIGLRHTSTPGDDDIFITTLHSNGTLAWAKTFGDAGHDYGLAISYTDSRLLFSGWTDSFSINSMDAIIASINSDESGFFNCSGFQTIQPDSFLFTPNITIISPNFNSISLNQIIPNLNITAIQLEEDFICNSAPATTGTTAVSETSTTEAFSGIGTSGAVVTSEATGTTEAILSSTTQNGLTTGNTQFSSTTITENLATTGNLVTTSTSTSLSSTGATSSLSSTGEMSGFSTTNIITSGSTLETTTYPTTYLAATTSATTTSTTISNIPSSTTGEPHQEPDDNPLILALSLGISGLGGLTFCLGCISYLVWKKNQAKQAKAITPNLIELDDQPVLSAQAGLAPIRVDKGHTKIGGKYALINKITQEEAQELMSQEGIEVTFLPGKKKTRFMLGQGQFGKLRLAKNLQMQQFVGVKKIKTSEAITASKNEAKLQAKLANKPYIMPLLDSVETISSEGEPVLYQFMPLAGFGSGEIFQQALSRLENETLKNLCLIHVARSLLVGLSYMHQAHIYHLDIKPANFVIDQKGQVFIIDFGCAVEAATGLIDWANGDTRYYAPERLANCRYQHIQYANSQKEKVAQYSGAKADSWALGLTLLEIYLNFYPLERCGFQDKLANWNTNYIIQMLDRLSILQDYSADSLLAVIKGLLTIKSEDRLSPDEALAMPIFTDPNNVFVNSSAQIQAFKQLKAQLKNSEVSSITITATSDKTQDENYAELYFSKTERVIKPRMSKDKVSLKNNAKVMFFKPVSSEDSINTTAITDSISAQNRFYNN